ncbi:lysophospholipid acyltransferase family protein [Chloroflexota bacterium]
MSWFYYAGRLLTRMLLGLFTRCQVEGKKNVPRQGPLLVVANHVNAADPPLLAVSLGRKVLFMAKEELFRSRFVGYFIRGYGAFPVHRGRLDRKALRSAHQLLEQGTALAMFPEGSRSPNGQLQPPLPGSALIAARSGAPILPVGIIGTKKLRGITWLLRRPRITVNIGPAFSLPPAGSRLTKAELAEHCNLIMKRIAELLPKEYRGDYGA